MTALVRALLLELEAQSERFEIAPETIYFGGGTPSLLSTKALTELLKGIRSRVDCENLREWSTEANPMTFDAGKAAVMREYGIDRVSLGVQSWNARLLKLLGRDHTP